MQGLPYFILFSAFISFSSAQASKVGLTSTALDAGSIFVGHSQQTATMLCSGALIDCDMVLTAAHCLKNRHIAENTFWFYLQHSGVIEVKRAEIELFCDSHNCPNQSFGHHDLALLRLVSSVRKNNSARGKEIPVEVKEVDAHFVGFGIKPPELDNYNLKWLAPIRLTECKTSASQYHTLCSDLDEELPAPCHKDSGGPLYHLSEGSGDSLLGIAIGTGLGCRSGQAHYADIRSPVVQAWLDAHTGNASDPCLGETQTPKELLSEPEGWFDKKSQYQELDFEVVPGLDALLVNMNHEPGQTSGGLQNNFDLELTAPSDSGKKTAMLISHCDNTWKLLSICHVKNPEPGLWKARVSRIHGEGHFQLVATGITK